MASSSTTTAIPGSGLQMQNSTVEETGDGTDDWMTSTAPRIAFLSAFLFLGFCGNLFLTITVCHSRRFRSVAFYVFIINLAVVNICECLLNMIVLLSASVLGEWTFGELACRFSVFCFNVICIETFLGLTILTTDRMISVAYKEQYDHMLSTARLSIMIAFTWFQALSFGIPILADAIPTSENSYLNTCLISEGSSIVYSIFTALFCFAVPLITMIVFFIKIIRTGYKERLLVRTLISQHNYRDDGQQEPRIKTEIRYTNLTGTLCGTWLVLEGPYVVTSYFRQFKNSSELESIADKDLQYIWYVDLILLWLRFSYTLALPIAVFSWHKELWKSLKDIVLCRKNNAVIDESFKKNESDQQKLERKIKDEEAIKVKEALSQNREQKVFQVPVLFATSHGVHIQTHDQSDVSDNEKNESAGRNVTLRGKKCDVIGSRDNLNNLEDDTSDYDSGNENDPFSLSHPISVKQLNSNELTDRKRSLSQPEVRDKAITGGKTYNASVGTTSGADSGVDLSTLSYKNSGQNSFNITAIRNKENVPKETNTVMDDAIQDPKDNNQNTDLDVETSGSLQKPDHSLNDTIDKSNYEMFTKEPAQVSQTDFQETPNKTLSAQRRKKKKRKDKSEGRNSVPSSPMLPLRPPPRLAPIVNNHVTKTLYSNVARPGSACSSNFSLMDGNFECVHSHGLCLNCDNCRDVAKSDINSCDNISVASFSMRSHLNDNLCIIKSNGADDNRSVNSNLDVQTRTLNSESKREISCVPEEVLTPREGDQQYKTRDSFDNDQLRDRGGYTDSYSGIVNNGYEHNSDDVINEVSPQTQGRVKNNEARRKRREKLTCNPLANMVNDGKAYQRLMPDTP